MCGIAGIIDHRSKWDFQRLRNPLLRGMHYCGQHVAGIYTSHEADLWALPARASST